MKKFFVAGLLALELMIAGCGSSSSTPQSIASGNWLADLQGGAGEAGTLSFQTSFSVGTNNNLSFQNLTFLNTQQCFVSGATESGTLAITSGLSTTVTGNLTITITSGIPAGNTLTLTGAQNGTTATGTWTLTGGAGDKTCVGGGSFTMTQQ